MIYWLFYTFKLFGLLFLPGVSLSCFIGGCYTTNPPIYLVFLNISNSPLLIQYAILLFSLYETITSSLLRAIQSEMKSGHYINEYE